MSAVSDAVTWFCGVTTEPWKSTPVFSVVVVTLPNTCGRVAARAWRISPSARRMPVAAATTVGFFSIARRIASSKVTRSLGVGACATAVDA